jgi:hypothetical protein
LLIVTRGFISFPESELPSVLRTSGGSQRVAAFATPEKERDSANIDSRITTVCFSEPFIDVSTSCSYSFGENQKEIYAGTNRRGFDDHVRGKIVIRF